MPRYFFDVQDGFERRDEIGREVMDTQALRREVLRVMNAATSQEDEDGKGFTIVVSVRDVTGANVLILRTVCQFDEISTRLLSAVS